MYELYFHCGKVSLGSDKANFNILDAIFLIMLPSRTPQNTEQGSSDLDVLLI